jgi:predicted nucleic acid-binding protein
MWYIDSSALVKLVVLERESEALVRFVHAQDGSIVTSDLGSVEVMRFGHRHEVPELARAVVDSIARLRVTYEIWERAGAILPRTSLRALDAIHIACAASTPSVRGIVTYDARMADAASILGVAVHAPRSGSV